MPPPSSQADWVRRLAPLILDGEPLEAQLGRRFGASVVATGLFLSLQLFFLVLFAGFGRWEVGFVIAVSLGPIEAWIWRGYFRLRRSVAEYRLAHRAGGVEQNHRPR